MANSPTPRSLRGRVVLKFPANIVAGDGIIITKTNQNYIISATGAGGGGGVPEAPADGTQYGRQNRAWTPIVHTEGGGTGATGAFVRIIGDTMTGDLVMRYATPNIVLNRQIAGQSGHFQGKFQDKLRWQMSLGDIDGESTGNAGSNFRLQCYNDAGTSIIGIPLYIRRDTGKVTIGGPSAAPPGTPLLAINKIVAGLSCSIRGELNGNARWQMSLGDQDAEVGGDSGSNFRLQCYNSSGSIIAVPMSVTRATGQVSFNGGTPIGEGQPIVVINSQDTTVPAAIQGQFNGARRWQMALGDVSAQDDFRLQCYRDDGVLQAIPFWCRRSDGKVTISCNTPTGTAMLDLNRISLSPETGLPKPPISTGAQANSNISGSVEGMIRWHLSLGDTDPEIQAETGSNFRIHAYSADAFNNVGLGPLMYGIRGTQEVYFFNTVYVPNGAGGFEALGSDSRIKTVLANYTDGIDKLKHLQPKVYTFRANDVPHRPPPWTIGSTPPGTPNSESPHYRAAVDGIQYVGLIAQDVEPWIPEMVTEREADVDGTHITDYKGLNTGLLIPLFINCIKELNARIEVLESALRIVPPPPSVPEIVLTKKKRNGFWQ